MDTSSPISSVIPGAYGPVLMVLARTTQPLSGRQVSALTQGRVSQSQVNKVLTDLARAGVVHRQDRPPAKVYTLNREHLAAPAVEALAGMREALLARLRELATAWALPAVAVWLFGSGARGDGDSSSDLDVLVVRPDQTLAEDQTWSEQVQTLEDHVLSWTGNACNILELSESDFQDASARGERLVAELRRDALTLAGRTPQSLARQRRGEARS